MKLPDMIISFGAARQPSSKASFASDIRLSGFIRYKLAARVLTAIRYPIELHADWADARKTAARSDDIPNEIEAHG
jgi:hypothetical protein